MTDDERIAKAQFDSWVLGRAAKQWVGRTEPIASISVSRADWPFKVPAVMVDAIHVSVDDYLDRGDITVRSR